MYRRAIFATRRLRRIKLGRAASGWLVRAPLKSPALVISIEWRSRRAPQCARLRHIARADGATMAARRTPEKVDIRAAAELTHSKTTETRDDSRVGERITRR